MKRHVVEIDGETVTIAELARRVGITPAAIRKRLRKYGPDPKVLLAPPKAFCMVPKRSINGVSLAAAARDAGLKYSTVHKRLSRGATPEEAIDPNLDPRQRVYRWRGEHWSLSELAQVVGMAHTTLLRRLRAAADLHEALSTPITCRNNQSEADGGG